MCMRVCVHMSVCVYECECAHCVRSNQVRLNEGYKIISCD